jgi:5'-nucleotidase (lipoprotein e(P4) family)
MTFALRPHRLARARALLAAALIAALPAFAQDNTPPVAQRELLGSTLWFQTAHEYRFNAAQTYRAAQTGLKAAMAQSGTASLEQESTGGFKGKPAAVVLDLDETMLDNSAFQGWLVKTGQPYSDEAWARWLDLKQATAIPGALSFARSASQAGAKLFYISNRACKAQGDCPAKASTMANMKALGFPRAADPSAYLLRNEKPEWAGDKVSRRQAVAATHRIVMLLGDDLQDFMSAEQAKALRAGDATAEARYTKLLGQRWFMLANPMYGSWERALPAGLPGHYSALNAAPLDTSVPPPPPPPAGKLTLATWNMEWLMTPETFDALAPHCDKQGQPKSSERAIPCTGGKLTIARRTQADFDALTRVAERTHADVIAVQEVDGPEAGARVFRQGWKLDCFVSRAHPQKVGFAIREGIPYRCNPEFAALDIDKASRAGADITLFPDTPQAIRLLSVHLKSGCFQGPLTSTSNTTCAKLRAQVPVLEQWVDARATEGVAYAILGDFNRRLELDAAFPAGPDESMPTSVFQALSDGQPMGALLKRASEGQPDVKCSTKDKNPPSPIDNLLLSAMLVARSTSMAYERITYDNTEAASLNLSDHCPGVLTLQGAR